MQNKNRYFSCKCQSECCRYVENNGAEAAASVIVSESRQTGNEHNGLAVAIAAADSLKLHMVSNSDSFSNVGGLCGGV